MSEDVRKLIGREEADVRKLIGMSEADEEADWHD